MPDYQQTLIDGGTPSTRADIGRLSSLGLLLASVGTGLLAPEMLPVVTMQHEATQAVAEETLSISTGDLLGAITQLHDELLSRTRELDPEARAVLYDNLWDLYQE